MASYQQPFQRPKIEGQANRVTSSKQDAQILSAKNREIGKQRLNEFENTLLMREIILIGPIEIF